MTKKEEMLRKEIESLDRLNNIYKDKKLEQKLDIKMAHGNKPRTNLDCCGRETQYIYFEDALGNLLIALYNSGITPIIIPLERISAYGQDVANYLNEKGIRTVNVESIRQVASFVFHDERKRFTENTGYKWKLKQHDKMHKNLIGINDALDVEELEKEFRSNLPTEMQEAFMDEEINKKAVDAFKQDSYSLTLKPSKKNEQ